MYSHIIILGVTAWCNNIQVALIKIHVLRCKKNASLDYLYTIVYIFFLLNPLEPKPFLTIFLNFHFAGYQF
jgi:hypothetical protein